MVLTLAKRSQKKTLSCPFSASKVNSSFLSHYQLCLMVFVTSKGALSFVLALTFGSAVNTLDFP